jgi:hypothetical protein
MQVHWRSEQLEPPTKLNAKYWRDRAAATMAQADRLIGEKQKLKLLRIALEYDKLADAAALREAPLPKQTHPGGGRLHSKT